MPGRIRRVRTDGLDIAAAGEGVFGRAPADLAQIGAGAERRALVTQHQHPGRRRLDLGDRVGEVARRIYGTPDAVNDTRCVNFQAGPDETVNFIVDNQRPGGEPRTPGYWKNWSSCSGGGQYNTAQLNGGSATGWWTICWIQ